MSKIENGDFIPEDSNKKEDKFFDVFFGKDQATIHFAHQTQLALGVLHPDTTLTTPAITTFVVKIGAPVYPGLELIHSQDQSVLPGVVGRLHSYKAEYDDVLTTGQRGLLNSAIQGLGRIINPEPDESLSK